MFPGSQSNRATIMYVLQKFDVYGNELWAEGGLLISDHTQDTWLTDWDMTVDQAGSCYFGLE